MRILKYKILTRQGTECKDELTEVVNEYMDNGWQPLGGVSLSYSNFAPHLAQAMAYYEEAKDANIDYEVKKECEHFWGVGTNVNTKERYSVCLKCGHAPSLEIHTEGKHEWGIKYNRDSQISWDECINCGVKERYSDLRPMPRSCHHRLAAAVNGVGQIFYPKDSEKITKLDLADFDIFKFCPDCGKCLIDVYGNRE